LSSELANCSINGLSGEITPARQILLGITQGDLYVQWQHSTQGWTDRHIGIVAAEDDILIVREAFGITTEIGLGLEAISKTRDHGWSGVHHTVVEMRHQSRIVSEVGQLDYDLDRFADLVLAQSVPKVFKAELAVALRQAGVENELQGSDEVALANFVLADDYDALAGSHIEFGKIREIR
jgi:hypothetical protein